MIFSFINQDYRTWDEHLSEFRFAYNTAHHSSLNTTPSFLNFGRNPQPINSPRHSKETKVEIDPQAPELWKERMERIQVMKDKMNTNFDKAFKKQSKQYNLRRRQFQLSVGDLVLTRSRIQSSKIKNFAAKLNPKLTGPFRVTKILSPNVYQISDLINNKLSKVHVQDLKPYIPND